MSAAVHVVIAVLTIASAFAVVSAVCALAFAIKPRGGDSEG